MDHDSPWDKFTWAIKNFSGLDDKEYVSDKFIAGGYMWHLVVYPKGYDEDEDGLPVYLEVADSETQPSGWSRDAKFILSIINQFDGNLTKSREAQCRFKADHSIWGFSSLICLSKLHDPKRGYLVNDTCIVEAQVYVRGADNTNKNQEVTLESEAIPCAENYQGIPLLCGAKSRTSSIAPPPTNLTKPLSTLKKRSKIASTILHGFILEFVEDFPTYEKFGQVMEDFRATMYGGKMGDIFEEWRPRILEIEALLAEIEDMDQQSEALQRDALSKLEESLVDVWLQLESKRKELHATIKKWKELKSAEFKDAPERLNALKEIKKLNQQEQDVITNIEEIIAGAGEGKKVIAGKKAKIVEWLSNPLASQNP